MWVVVLHPCTKFEVRRPCHSEDMAHRPRFVSALMGLMTLTFDLCPWKFETGTRVASKRAFIATQLNSARRRVVDTFTAWTTITDWFWTVCRSWRHIIWRVLTSLPGDGILEWRIWRKLNRIMGIKHACLYDISTKAFSTGNKNTTDLLRADWLYAVQLGQLHCRSSATVELRRWRCL